MKRSRVRLALLLPAMWLAACDGAQPAADPAAPPDPPAALPVADPPFDREAILLAVLRTGSEWAAGNRDPASQRPLDGRRFELRLRLDCPGDAGAPRWSLDEAERVLRIAVEPAISAETPLLTRLALPEFEAAEGFWIERSWMLQAVCPARPAAPAAPEAEPAAEAGDEAPKANAAETAPEPAAPAPRVGIAQFYTDQDARSARRESRAYSATVRLREGQEPVSGGYDLVLSGRLSALPDGRVIACTGAPGAAPACVVSARFDHVALARSNGEVLAQWSSG